MMDKKGSVNLLSRVFLMISFFIVVFAACSRENYPDDKPDVPKVDTTAPVIKVLHASVDITGVEEITIRTNALYIGELLVATWSDNVTTNCRVSMTINGNNITSGSVPIVSGTLTLTVTDDAGNSSTATIKLTMKETHPDITIYYTEVNVYGGVQLGISYDHLTIDGEQVMAWSDKTTSQCKVAVSQGGNALKDGDMLSEAGMLKVVVTNGQGKSSTGEIELVSNPIEGLENLYAAELQVGKETDLLDGLTFVNGATLIKTEIEMDGTRSTIDDATRFTPELPGQCDIIFTVQGQDGTTTQVVAENLTIKPMEYHEPTIATADMINTLFPWYKKDRTNEEIRQFIYPHLLISYAACNHSELPNRVHIIVAETTDSVDEIIGGIRNSSHATAGYYRLRCLCPKVTIKACYEIDKNGEYPLIEEYANDHKEQYLFLSQAVDCVFDTYDGFYTSPYSYISGKNLLQNKNIILAISASNSFGDCYKVFNENIKGPDSSDHVWNSASINSSYNNKITAEGYDFRKLQNWFAPSSANGILSGRMPVGFEKDKGNIVMPMTALVNMHNYWDPGTATSYPAAVVSGVIGNAVSVVLMNRPELSTAVDAMDVIVNKYLREETFQYKDSTTNWQLVDGGQWYFIKAEELMDNELLQAEKLERLTLNGDDVELPFGRGICYLGKGVQFELDGVRHDISETAALTEALKAGSAKWYWNRRAFRRYGDADIVDLHVYVVDKNGEKFPDLELNITKPVN